MAGKSSPYRSAALAAQKAAWEGTLSEVPEKTLAEIIGVSVQMVRLYRDGKNLLPLDAHFALLINNKTYFAAGNFADRLDNCAYRHMQFVVMEDDPQA